MLKRGLTKKEMIEEIMLVVKANALRKESRLEGRTDEVLLGLVFCDEQALRSICCDLCIRTTREELSGGSV